MVFVNYTVLWMFCVFYILSLTLLWEQKLGSSKGAVSHGRKEIPEMV